MQLMRLRPPPLKPALPPEPQNPLPPRPSRLFCGQVWSIRSPPRIHHSLRLLPPRPLPPKGLSSPRVPSYPPHRQRGCQTINLITALCFNIPDTIKTRTFKTAHAVRGRGQRGQRPAPFPGKLAAAPEGAGHQPAQARASGSIHRQSRGAWPAGLGGEGPTRPAACPHFHAPTPNPKANEAEAGEAGSGPCTPCTPRTHSGTAPRV